MFSPSVAVTEQTPPHQASRAPRFAEASWLQGQPCSRKGVHRDSKSRAQPESYLAYHHTVVSRSRSFGHVTGQTSSPCQTGNTSPRLLCPKSRLPLTIHQAAEDVDLRSCSPSRRHVLPMSSRIRFHALTDFAANFALHASSGKTTQSNRCLSA